MFDVVDGLSVPEHHNAPQEERFNCSYLVQLRGIQHHDELKASTGRQQQHTERPHDEAPESRGTEDGQRDAESKGSRDEDENWLVRVNELRPNRP